MHGLRSGPVMPQRRADGGYEPVPVDPFPQPVTWYVGVRFPAGPDDKTGYCLGHRTYWYTHLGYVPCGVLVALPPNPWRAEGALGQVVEITETRPGHTDHMGELRPVLRIVPDREAARLGWPLNTPHPLGTP